MKAIIITLLLAAAAHQASAQANRNSMLEGAAAVQNIKDLQNATSVTGSFQVYDNRYKGTKGTPYYWDNWAKGILRAGKMEYQDLAVKYNVHDNEVLYQDASGNKFILSTNQLSSFTLTDSLGLQTAIFKKVPEVAKVDPALANKFFVMLHEGQKSQLVLDPQKTLLKADFKGPYSTGREHDEFVEIPAYFLIFGDSAVQKVKLNKRTFMKAIPANKDMVEGFIKENNLNLDSEAGWVKALAYYETL